MVRLRGKLENKKVTEPKQSKRGSMRIRKPAGGTKILWNKYLKCITQEK